jgi:hypothetical protein
MRSNGVVQRGQRDADASALAPQEGQRRKCMVEGRTTEAPPDPW